jgi:hypothetical protein
MKFALQLIKHLNIYEIILTSFSARGHHQTVVGCFKVIIVGTFIISTNSEAIKNYLDVEIERENHH